MKDDVQELRFFGAIMGINRDLMAGYYRLDNYELGKSTLKHSIFKADRSNSSPNTCNRVILVKKSTVLSIHNV